MSTQVAKAVHLVWILKAAAYAEANPLRTFASLLPPARSQSLALHFFGKEKRNEGWLCAVRRVVSPDACRKGGNEKRWRAR